MSMHGQVPYMPIDWLPRETFSDSTGHLGANIRLEHRDGASLRIRARINERLKVLSFLLAQFLSI